MSIFKIECGECKRRGAGWFICTTGAWFCRNR